MSVRFTFLCGLRVEAFDIYLSDKIQTQTCTHRPTLKAIDDLDLMYV